MKSPKAIVIEMYDIGYSTRQIATHFQCSKSMIALWIKEAGKSRTHSTAAMLRKPPKSTHWRSTRAAARKKYQRTHKVILGPRQHIHHIDGDCTNNDLDNLAVVDCVDHAYIHHPRNPVPRHLRPERKIYMKKYLKAYHAQKRKM